MLTIGFSKPRWSLAWSEFTPPTLTAFKENCKKKRFAALQNGSAHLPIKASGLIGTQFNYFFFIYLPTPLQFSWIWIKNILSISYPTVDPHRIAVHLSKIFFQCNLFTSALCSASWLVVHHVNLFYAMFPVETAFSLPHLHKTPMVIRFVFSFSNSGLIF